MRHHVAGRKLSRNSAHRKALRRNLAKALIQHGAIKTTEAKAKELRRFIEKLITIARAGTLHARRRVASILQQDQSQLMWMVQDGGQNPDRDCVELEETAVERLFNVIAPQYKDRPGGYTRIIRLADRRIGDGGKQVMIQLIEDDSTGGREQVSSGRRSKRASKRYEAAQKIGGSKDAEVDGRTDAEETAQDAEASVDPSDADTSDTVEADASESSDDVTPVSSEDTSETTEE